MEPNLQFIICFRRYTSVGEDDVNLLALRNRTADGRVRIKRKTLIRREVLTNFVFNSVPIKEKSDALKLPVEFLKRVHCDLDLDNSSEFRFFARNILSTTEKSEVRLSETEIKRRTDPQLLKAIAGTDVSSVFSSWGEGAREKLQDIINEYEDLFMKNKADIGRCKVAKQN